MKAAITGAVLLTLLACSSAGAKDFVGSYSESHNLSSMGLKIGTSPLGASDDFSFSLDPGGSTTVDLYQIYADETTVNSDDTVAQPISTLLDIAGAASSETVKGSTVGVRDTDGYSLGFPNNHQYGEVDWDSSELFSFSDGSSLKVTLNNTHFDEGEYYALAHGGAPYGGTEESNGKPITATFLYTGALAPVSGAPEPGSWSLMIAGVGLLGGWLRLARGRRRLPTAHMASL